MLARGRRWMPIHWRIAPILTATMILLTVGFITTTTVLDISRTRRIYWDELRARGRLLAGQMSDQLADPLYLNDIEDIQKIADIVGSQPDIAYVSVFTPEGAVLVDTSISGFQSLGTRASDLGLRALGEQQAIEERNGDVMEIAEPVTIGNQMVGGVQIGLRSDVLQRQITAIIVEHLLQGVVLAALAAGIAYLIARRFSRPVQTLVTATNDMASGRLDTRVHGQQSGELRELAGSFNAMAQELQTTIHDLRESRTRIVGVQEGVRREIASHLHGRVQAKLLILRTQIERMLRRMGPAAASETELDDLVSQLDDLIQNDITSLSRRLYPSILRRGMIPALQSLGDQFQSSLTIRMDVGPRFSQLEEADPNVIPESVKLAGYRIAEDALTNVLKHANATAVLIHVELEDSDQLRLSIEDNGGGFDLGGGSRGLGLAAMEDYAGAVGGHCRIRSAIGKGSVVTAHLPIYEPQLDNT